MMDKLSKLALKWSLSPLRSSLAPKSFPPPPIPPIPPLSLISKDPYPILRSREGEWWRGIWLCEGPPGDCSRELDRLWGLDELNVSGLLAGSFIWFIILSIYDFLSFKYFFFSYILFWWLLFIRVKCFNLSLSLLLDVFWSGRGFLDLDLIRPRKLLEPIDPPALTPGERPFLPG